MSNIQTKKIDVKKVFSNLEYHIIQFDKRGSIEAVSKHLIKKLGVEKSKEKLVHLLPTQFFVDIFGSTQKWMNLKKAEFKNYRVSVKNLITDELYSFHVSGYLDEGKIVTVWQVLKEKDVLSKKEIQSIDNSQFQDLVKPYISTLVMYKAREALKQGKRELTNEIIEATILFTDLVGFTERTEILNMQEVVEMLNTAFSIAVRNIEKHNGSVDKFIGDAVMAIFNNPSEAVIAAVETQNQFYQLNELRAMMEQDPIHLRIGIHTGKVILSSIGVKGRMDWTAIGDVVNTASRIERKSSLDCVLISENTYSHVKDHVEVQYQTEVNVKGKKDNLKVYYVKSVKTIHEGKERKLLLRPFNSEEEAEKETASKDALTGLSNYNEFCIVTNQILKLGLRNKNPFLLFLINVEPNEKEKVALQEFNEIIRHSAIIISSCFRDSDIISRYGSNKFIVFAMDAQMKSLPVITQRLQSQVTRFNSVHSRNLILEFGFSSFTDNKDYNLKSLISTAKSRLKSVVEARVS